jgi:hypothetical protein
MVGGVARRPQQLGLIDDVVRGIDGADALVVLGLEVAGNQHIDD